MSFSFQTLNSLRTLDRQVLKREEEDRSQPNGCSRNLRVLTPWPTIRKEGNVGQVSWQPLSFILLGCQEEEFFSPVHLLFLCVWMDGKNSFGSLSCEHWWSAAEILKISRHAHRSKTTLFFFLTRVQIQDIFICLSLLVDS